MAINFPDNPAIDEIFSDPVSKFSWQWDGTIWKNKADAVSTGELPDGTVYPSKLSTGGPSWNTIGNVTIFGTISGTTDTLQVEGGSVVTGILTVGSSPLTIDGDANTINGVTISSGIITAINVVATGITVGVSTINTTLHVTGNYKSGITSMAELDVNCSLGNYFTKTIAGVSTFTFSNVPSESAYSFTLKLTHTSGAITWPTEVKWPSDTPPTLTTGKTHLFTFVTDDGGTRWRGSSLVDYVN
jgi:hypothetical protein